MVGSLGQPHFSRIRVISHNSNFSHTIMSSTYLVAYPHPGICPAERIKQLELGPTTSGKTLLRLLQQLYPDYSNDLQRAKLRKVGCSTSVSDPTSTLTNIAGHWPQQCGPP